MEDYTLARGKEYSVSNDGSVTILPDFLEGKTGFTVSTPASKVYNGKNQSVKVKVYQNKSKIL